MTTPITIWATRWPTLAGFARPWPNTEQALRINPRLAKAHYQLGRALLDLGKTDQAIGEFRRTAGDRA